MTDSGRASDIEEIKQLRSRYLRLYDLKKFDEAAACYTEDATMRFEEEAPGQVFSGREALKALAAGALEDVVTVHHIHMPEIQFQSENEATAVWALEDLLWYGPKSVAPGRTIRAYGHIYDTYLRVDGRWLIKDIEIVRLRNEVTG